MSDQLLSSAITAAPWAKSGKIAVAATKPYLAGESQGSYVGWFNAPASSICAKAPTNSLQLEGVIDLVEAFGAMPTNIYLAAAAYATADGGALVAQAPAGSGPDLDTNEFLELPTAALADSNGDGVFDRLDPRRDFAVKRLTAGSKGCTLFWNAMPLHSYQVSFRDDLGGPVKDLTNSQKTAGPLDLEMSFTDPRSTNQQRFYQIKLLP